MNLPLPRISQIFQQDFSLSIRAAAELEFYLTGDKPEQDVETLAQLMLHCHQRAIALYGLQEEQGERQYELALTPQSPEIALQQLKEVKEILSAIALPSFAAKPYPDMPGSGLHLHVSLWNKAGENVLSKPEKTSEEESPAMLQAVAGLLASIPEHMHIYAPTADSLLRFDTSDPHTPRYLCWGGNNRTAAIRIPSSTLHPDQRHIELRVAGADADAEACLCAMLEGIHQGLTQRLTPPAKLYGNAFDAQYGLELLVKR